MVYAVESWILALLGWAWLSFQEMWAWSLLSAYVFYGLMLLGTLNVIVSGIAPESPAPRSGYFGAVLALSLHVTSCVLDTIPMPRVGSTEFASPVNATTCSLPKSNQLFFFGDSQLYLVQAGATMAYLVVQLVVSGAALLDSDLRTLWPGPSWACGLGVLLCNRFSVVFDGIAKGLVHSGRYLEIFSLPLVEYTFLLNGFTCLFGIMGGIDGLVFPGVNWRRSVRYVTLTIVLLFCPFLGYTLWVRGMLTPSVVGLLGIMVVSGLAGTLEAATTVGPRIPEPYGYFPGNMRGRPPAFQAGQRQDGAAWRGAQGVYPQGPVWRGGQGVYSQGAASGYARPGRLREFRHIIPSPFEMLGEKNKGV